MDSQAIQDSIVSIRDKVVPQAVSTPPVSAESGDIITTHAVYDFLGLNFANRTGRENLELSRKVKTVMEYAEENSEDPIGFLRQMEGKLGKADNIPLLDKLYHAVKFRETAEEATPVEDRKADYSKRASEAASKIEVLKKEIATAKETARVAKRLAIIEKQRAIYERKLSKLNG